MAEINVNQIADLAVKFLAIPVPEIYYYYDRKADEVVGLTVLHASQRHPV